MLPRLSHIKRLIAAPVLLAVALLFCLFEVMSNALIGPDPYDNDDEDMNS